MVARTFARISVPCWCVFSRCGLGLAVFPWSLGFHRGILDHLFETVMLDMIL